MKKFESEKEIIEVVESFEKGTISRTDWGHAEHLTVALYYLSHYEYEAAHERMRDGIFDLLKAFKVDFSKEMPYHKTMTVFWLKTVDKFRRTETNLSIVEICNALIEKFDKNYPLNFYSRERLFSDDARAKFIEGDL